MELKKLFLPLDSKQDFIAYCNERSDRFNQKRIDRTILKNYFDFCAKRPTYTDIMFNTFVAGEHLGCGISQIRDLETGEIYSSQEDIYNFLKKQYEADAYGFICQELHSAMYCEIERLNRIAKQDAFEPSERRLWKSLKGEIL